MFINTIKGNIIVREITHMTFNIINVEQRTILRLVTIYRHLCFISCNLFIFHRKIFFYFFHFFYAYEIEIVLHNRFNGMAKHCFRSLKIVMVNCG